MGAATPEAYARWRASTLGAITERLETAAVLALSGEVAGRRVLEVGCGDGAYLIEAQRRGGEVCGVDTSEAMLEAASARLAAVGARADLQLASADRLPYPDGAFDTVMAITMLCFVADPGAALREMARVLAPGGRLVLGELHTLSTWALWRRLKSLVGLGMWRGVTFHTVAELRRLLDGAGLVPTASRGAAFYPPFGWAAQVVAPLDPILGRRLHVGAAFVAIAADKPPPSSHAHR